MVGGGGDRTPLLMVARCPSPSNDDPAWGCSPDPASVPPPTPPLAAPCVDHAQGKRKKILAKLGLSSVLSPRAPPATSTANATGMTKPRGRSISLSLSLPWTRQKYFGKGRAVTADIALKPEHNSCLKSRANEEEGEESPVLLTSPEATKRRKRRLWWTSRGYKTVPAEAQNQTTNQVSCERPSQAWVPAAPAWSSVIQGLQSVALVLVVTLLSPVGAFCPRGCVCDDQRLRSQCVNADLDVIPILMNPGTLELNLSHNKIKTILEGLTFLRRAALRGLKVLNLCKNELKHVFSEVFEPLRELEELDLCSNQITSIQNFAFKSLKGLSILKLSNNQMYHIQEKAFSGLDSLNLLGLKDNAFTSIPSLVLASISDLEELDFSINPLTSLPFGPFVHVPKLKSLHISRCENLSSIDSGAFTSLGYLTSLALSFNPQLTSLQRDVFKPLSSLRHLVLRGNGLRTFDRSLVSSTVLQSLDLRDNSLECNCSIKWLQEASLNNSISLKIEEILCAGPELLRGRSLSELSEYDLECYNNVVVVASCAAASMALVLLLVAFGIVYYKNCRKMKAMVHDHWPEKIVATWKDPEYQKQQLEDEEYTFHSLRGELGGDQPPPAGLHDELINRTKALKNTFKPEDTIRRSSRRSGNSRTLQDHYSSLKAPSRATQEGYFGVVPLENGVGCNNGSSGNSNTSNGIQRISHYLPPSPPPGAAPRNHKPPIYAEPQIKIRPGSSDGAATKTSKDSGYYSCEFLDQNPYTGSMKEASKARGNSFHSSRSLGRHLPPSDSGVFTLSHVYARQGQQGFSSHQEGIYDNII
ncbi:hypothetical protein O3P69_004550 [Scylla paramamosain]|uniref:LRRCT domain-containing protein n=1 Tax=Scylla paramamosain TaxID=85552 RepID=A0AAW0UEU6_SCYPA